MFVHVSGLSIIIAAWLIARAITARARLNEPPQSLKLPEPLLLPEPEPFLRDKHGIPLAPMTEERHRAALDLQHFVRRIPLREPKRSLWDSPWIKACFWMAMVSWIAFLFFWPLY